jgi:hypothetical protein
MTPETAKSFFNTGKTVDGVPWISPKSISFAALEQNKPRSKPLAFRRPLLRLVAYPLVLLYSIQNELLLPNYAQSDFDPSI